MVIGIVAFVHLANTFAVLAGVMSFDFIVKGVFDITLSIGAKHILDVGLGGLGRRNADQVLVSIRQRCDKDGNARTQAGNDTQSDYKIVRADTGKSVPASGVPKGERLIAPESGRIDRAERRRMSRSGRSGERVRDGAGGAFSASGTSAPGTTTPPTTTTHRCWVCE